jgi:hypothetical protein
LTSAGAVGIGTASPAYRFNVVTDAIAGAQNLAAIDRTAQNFVTFTNPQFSTDASMGLVLRVFPQSDARQGTGILASGGAANGETDLNVICIKRLGAQAHLYRALMRITSAGNVGIGTSTPVSKLHVSGADAWMTLQRTSGTTNILDFTDSAAARLGYVGFIFSNLTLNAKAGSDIVFAPNNEERGRFTSNGLTFNGDTAAANALDDYEEGTWTPSVAFGGASVGLTYGRRGGTYTKIGRQVTVCGDLILSAKGSSTGNATIAGLPFTINGSSTDFLQAASFRFAEMSFSGLVQGYGGVSSTIINMEQVTSGAGAASITDADFEDGTQLMVSLTYFV